MCKITDYAYATLCTAIGLSSACQPVSQWASQPVSRL